jgi:hypothetical protein
VNYLGAAAHHVQDRRFYSWDVAIALFKVNPKECFLSKNDNLLTQVQISTLFVISKFSSKKRARGTEQERGFEKVTDYVLLQNANGVTT